MVSKKGKVSVYVSTTTEHLVERVDDTTWFQRFETLLHSLLVEVASEREDGRRPQTDKESSFSISSDEKLVPREEDGDA